METLSRLSARCCPQVGRKPAAKPKPAATEQPSSSRGDQVGAAAGERSDKSLQKMRAHALSERIQLPAMLLRCSLPHFLHPGPMQSAMGHILSIFASLSLLQGVYLANLLQHLLSLTIFMADIVGSPVAAAVSWPAHFHIAHAWLSQQHGRVPCCIACSSHMCCLTSRMLHRGDNKCAKISPFMGGACVRVCVWGQGVGVHAKEQS